MSNPSNPTTEYTHQSVSKTATTAPAPTVPAVATSSTDYPTKPQSEKSVLERSKESISNTFEHLASKLHSVSSSGSSSKDNLDKVLVDPNSTSAVPPAGITNTKTHSPSRGHSHGHGHGHNYNTEYAHTPIGYAAKPTSDIEGHKSVGQKVTDSARHAKNKVEDKIDEHTSSNSGNTYANTSSEDNYTYVKPQHHGPAAVDTSKEYINVVKNEKGETVERATETVHHGKGVTTTTSQHTVASTTAALPAGSHSSV